MVACCKMISGHPKTDFSTCFQDGILVSSISRFQRSGIFVGGAMYIYVLSIQDHCHKLETRIVTHFYGVSSHDIHFLDLFGHQTLTSNKTQPSKLSTSSNYTSIWPIVIAWWFSSSKVFSNPSTVVAPRPWSTSSTARTAGAWRRAARSWRSCWRRSRGPWGALVSHMVSDTAANFCWLMVVNGG